MRRESAPCLGSLHVGVHLQVCQGTPSAKELNGLRFASRNYVQALDGNMGAFIGEGFKVPYVLRMLGPEAGDGNAGGQREYHAHLPEAPALSDIVDAFEQLIWPRYRFSSIVIDMDFVEQDGPMDRAYHFQEAPCPARRGSRSMSSARPHSPWTPIVPVEVRAHPERKGRGRHLSQASPLHLRRVGRALQGCCRRRCRTMGTFRKRFCCVPSVCYDPEVKINPPIEKRKPFYPFSGRHIYTKSRWWTAS